MNRRTTPASKRSSSRSATSRGTSSRSASSRSDSSRSSSPTNTSRTVSKKPSSSRTGAKSTSTQKKTLGNRAETAEGRARNALLIDRQIDGQGSGVALILSAAERKSLKAAAHHLNPVVMIGQEGLSEAVIRETDRSLRAHALIKVRVAGDDRQTRQAILEALCEALGCAAVQSIGKLLVLYRPKDYS